MLQPRRHVNAAPHMCRVIALHDILAPIVELAVAQQKSQSDVRQIFLVKNKKKRMIGGPALIILLPPG